jgi:hypothetical protein
MRIASRATLLATLASVVALGATVPATADDPYWGPGYTSCGRMTMHSREAGTVKLYIATRHATCNTAVKIQREYWTAPKSRLKIVNGGSGASGYVLLKRYPGWKCTSGAGGCSRGKRTAAYSHQRT